MFIIEALEVAKKEYFDAILFISAIGFLGDY